MDEIERAAQAYSQATKDLRDASRHYAYAKAEHEKAEAVLKQREGERLSAHEALKAALDGEGEVMLPPEDEVV